MAVIVEQWKTTPSQSSNMAAIVEQWKTTPSQSSNMAVIVEHMCNMRCWQHEMLAT